MCGRFVNTHTTAQLAEHFDALTEHFDVKDRTNGALQPDYNIAPRKRHAIVRQCEEEQQLVVAQWGLIPSWAKDSTFGAKTFNARSETADEKPTFRSAVKRRRCIVPASGYYEWQRIGDKKQPWYIHESNDGIIGFAGLWESWKDPSVPEDDELTTFSILTMPAPSSLAEIHDRAPVIVGPHHWGLWLDAIVPYKELIADIIEDAYVGKLQRYRVENAVGNVRNNGELLIQPINEDQ